MDRKIGMPADARSMIALRRATCQHRRLEGSIEHQIDGSPIYNDHERRNSQSGRRRTGDINCSIWQYCIATFWLRGMCGLCSNGHGAGTVLVTVICGAFGGIRSMSDQ